MNIDPKAPANSPKHPANWRKPVFLAPGAYTMDSTPVQAVPDAPAAPATPAKKPAKKPAKRDLAAALAKLSDE